MPRSRGRSSSPARTQTRSAHTMAAPRPAPTQAQPSPSSYSSPRMEPVGQTKQPGMFAQMASTAAGVAVGSAVGHTIGAGISGMFGGSSSSDAAAPVQQDLGGAALQSSTAAGVGSCEASAKNFTKCLDENNGNFQICDYYLQQLKACQEAAKQYTSS